MWYDFIPSIPNHASMVLTASRQDIATKCLHIRLVLLSLASLTFSPRIHNAFLLTTALSWRFRSEPTVFENYVHDLYVDDQLVELSLWDTAGACVVVGSTFRALY
jgi:GTPase SAR1 family protein